MTRVKKTVASRRRRKSVLKKTKGQYGTRSKLYKKSAEALKKGLSYSYRDRKKKKSDFRKLWITRMSACCKEEGFSYNKFIAGLKKAKILLDRKQLAEMAVNDRTSFDKIVEIAKKAQMGTD